MLLQGLDGGELFLVALRTSEVLTAVHHVAALHVIGQPLLAVELARADNAAQFRDGGRRGGLGTWALLLLVPLLCWRRRCASEPIHIALEQALEFQVAARLVRGHVIQNAGRVALPRRVHALLQRATAGSDAQLLLLWCVSCALCLRECECGSECECGCECVSVDVRVCVCVCVCVWWWWWWWGGGGACEQV